MQTHFYRYFHTSFKRPLIDITGVFFFMLEFGSDNAERSTSSSLPFFESGTYGWGL